MYERKKTSGNANVDDRFDDVYVILNDLGASSGTIMGTTPSESVRTVEGGYGFPMTNGGGVVIEKGYLVSGLAADSSVALAPIGSYNIFGVAYEQIPVYGAGLIIFFGLVDVYFNSGGCSSDDNYFRISKTGDTGAGVGLAQSDSIDEMDRARVLGYPVATRSGAGLARCLLKR